MGNGGAVYCNNNCSFFADDFINNTAKGIGGAIYCINNCSFYSINFIKNSAYDAGAIFTNNYYTFYNLKFNNNNALNFGGAVYCSESKFYRSSFIKNFAPSGSAIYINHSPFVTIKDSEFLYNKANPNYEVINNKYLTLDLTLNGNNNFINAIYSWFNIEFNNVTYWNGTITNTNISTSNWRSCPGQNFTIEIYDSNNILVKKFNQQTNGAGKLIIDYSILDIGKYICKIFHYDDDYYTAFNTSSVLKVGEFGKLQHLWHFTNDNGIINLTQNYTFTQDFILNYDPDKIDLETIDLDSIDGFVFEYSNLTINDNGYTINALNNSVGMYLYKLHNLKFYNCNFAGNMFFRFLDMANITLVNCTFTNGTTAFHCVNSDTVNITGCTFDNFDFEGYSTENLINEAIAIQNAKYVIIENCDFTNRYAYYGTVYLYEINETLIAGCNFINNSAETGGAINGLKLNKTTMRDCNFFNNSAITHGGAISLVGEYLNLIVNNSVFMNNSANSGAAMFCDGENIVLIDSIFLENKALSSDLNGEIDDLQITITFSGNNNFINAIRSYPDPTFKNVTYWNGTITNTDITHPRYNSYPGQNITIEIYDEFDNLIETIHEKTNENNQIIYNMSNIPSETYKIVFYHEDDGYYANSTTGDLSFEKDQNISDEILA